MSSSWKDLERDVAATLEETMPGCGAKRLLGKGTAVPDVGCFWLGDRWQYIWEAKRRRDVPVDRRLVELNSAGYLPYDSGPLALVTSLTRTPSRDELLKESRAILHIRMADLMPVLQRHATQLGHWNGPLLPLRPLGFHHSKPTQSDSLHTLFLAEWSKRPEADFFFLATRRHHQSVVAHLTWAQWSQHLAPCYWADVLPAEAVDATNA